MAHVKALEQDYLEVKKDNQEMQSINEELLAELEKKDSAIQEAVGLICDLEAKLDQLVKLDKASVRSASNRGRTQAIQENNHIDASTVPGPNVPRTPSPIPSRPVHIAHSEMKRLSEPKYESMLPSSESDSALQEPSRKWTRTPRFLRTEDPSTQALRKVYGMDGNIVKSTHSLASSMHRAQSNRHIRQQRARADVDNYTLPSPRFSELSEGDFESIYGERKRSITPSRQAYVDEEHVAGDKILERPAQQHSRSYSSQNSTINDWVQDTKQRTSPLRRKPPGKSGNGYGSIETVIGNHQDLPKSLPAPLTQARKPPPLFAQTSSDISVSRPAAAFGGPIFNGSVLPPTPDTMSTSNPHTNRSNPSIITDKSSAGGFLLSPRDFTKLVLEQRPHTSNGPSKERGDEYLDDSDLEEEDDDIWRSQDINVPPRPPPHKTSNSSFSERIKDREHLDRPRLGVQSGDQSQAASRTMSYPASESTTRRRSSVHHGIASPERAIIATNHQQEAHTPSEKSANGGVLLLRQSSSHSTHPLGSQLNADTAARSFKPLSRNTGSSAMTRFFRRTSLQSPESLTGNEPPQQSQHPAQTRPSLAQQQSATGNRRLSFQGINKSSRTARPRTSGGPGLGEFPEDKAIMAGDNQTETLDELRGGRGIGHGIGKKLAGLGRRGSRGRR